MIEDGADKGKRVLVSDCPGVQYSVIHDGLKFSVFLLSEEEWGCVQGIGFLNISLH